MVILKTCNIHRGIYLKDIAVYFVPWRYHGPFNIMWLSLDRKMSVKTNNPFYSDAGQKKNTCFELKLKRGQEFQKIKLKESRVTRMRKQNAYRFAKNQLDSCLTGGEPSCFKDYVLGQFNLKLGKSLFLKSGRP